MFSLGQLLMDYFERPIETKWSLKREETIAVPSFKICLVSYGNAEKIRRSDDLLIRYWIESNSNQHTNRSKEIDAAIANCMTRPIGDFWKEMMFETNDVFKSVINTTHEMSGPKILRKSLLLDTILNFKECWDFNTPDKQGDILHMGRDDRLVLSINSKTGQFLWPVPHSGITLQINKQEKSSPNDLIGIKPGTKNFLTFAKSEFIFLPPPYDSLKPS